MSYSHKNIWINGRFVHIQSIVDEQITALTEFEQNTFSFIRDWFTDKEEFTLQTSGSTGEPKRISITRQQIVASALASERALDLKKNYSALVCIDTKYIGGKMMLARSFVTDMKIWAVDPCACPLQKIPVDHCVNFAAFVPYQVHAMIASNHPHLLDNPDTIIIGGAPVDEHLIKKLQSYRSRFYATYGMTETISHVALRLLNSAERSDLYHTLPEVNITLDSRNCIVINAPYLAQEVVTNDLAEFTTSGQFRWLGRYDNVINTGGVKVIPEKIEAALNNIFSEAGISNRFFIHSIPDVALGNKVILVLEASDNVSHIVEKILPRFPFLQKFERPKAIFTVTSFVSGGNGKINRFKTLENVDSSFPVVSE